VRRREKIGAKLIEWAHRVRRSPESPFFRLGDWQLPQRGFLVYGECECGWWCACPEGGLWPHCPNCGKQVLPPPGEFGNPHGRMGFVTHVMDETEAVKGECP
jgi:hypothetical protein